MQQSHTAKKEKISLCGMQQSHTAKKENIIVIF
jgi:hypothetical protein